MKKCVLLFCVFLCFSCDTGNGFEEPMVHTKLLKNVFLNDELLFNYDYFANGKIKSQLNILNLGLVNISSFEYSNDTVYKITTGLSSSKFKSYQTSDISIEFLEFDIDDNLLFSYVSTYLSEDCGLSKSQTYTQFGDLYTTTEYEYLDFNCSYTARRELFNGVQKNNYAITKDDKNNYRASINEWSNFENKHNIIEYRQWDENDNLLLNQSYNSIFTYDSMDYPIQETRTSLSGNTKIYTYEYYSN
jgi:hypothetical protein